MIIENIKIHGLTKIIKCIIIDRGQWNGVEGPIEDTCGGGYENLRSGAKQGFEIEGDKSNYGRLLGGILHYENMYV